MGAKLGLASWSSDTRHSTYYIIGCCDLKASHVPLAFSIRRLGIEWILPPVTAERSPPPFFVSISSLVPKYYERVVLTQHGFWVWEVVFFFHTTPSMFGCMLGGSVDFLHWNFVIERGCYSNNVCKDTSGFFLRNRHVRDMGILWEEKDLVGDCIL